MRKIQYKEKAVQAILKYLESQELVSLDLQEDEIIIQTQVTNQNKIFHKLSQLVEGSKYGVQKDIKTLTVVVFNSLL